MKSGRDRLGNSVFVPRPFVLASLVLALLALGWVLYDLYPVMLDKAAMQDRVRTMIKVGDHWATAGARLRTAGFLVDEIDDSENHAILSAVVYMRVPKLLHVYQQLAYKLKRREFVGWDAVIVNVEMDTSGVVTAVEN